MNKKTLFHYFFIIVMLCMSIHSYGYVKMIRPDRVWVYYGEAVDVLPRGGYARHFYKFGEEITVDGKKYTSFGLFKTQYIETEYVFDENHPGGHEIIIGSYMVERTDGLIHFIREEESGKVFALGKDAPNNHFSEDGCELVILRQDFNSFSADKFILEEDVKYADCLIYDFNAPNGWIMPHIGYDFYNSGADIGDEGPILQYLADTIDIEGEKCRQYDIAWNTSDIWNSTPPDFSKSKIKDFSMIEGIGITCNGNLACYDTCFALCECGMNGDYPEQLSYLEGVYNLSEEPIVIYKDRLLKDLADINKISENSDIEPDELYDILGRQISNPLPGSVYIRAGKKYVAR